MVAAQSEVVVALSEALELVESVAEAQVVLSFASMSSLRDIEYRFGLASVLGEAQTRLRLAQVAYQRACYRREGKVSDTSLVGPQHVLGWALSRLVDWLPGFTEHDPQAGGVYLVSVGDLAGNPEPTGLVVEVRTEDGADPRRFLVALAVAEIGGAGRTTDQRADVIQQAIRDFAKGETANGDPERDLALFIVHRLNKSMEGSS